MISCAYFLIPHGDLCYPSSPPSSRSSRLLCWILAVHIVVAALQKAGAIDVMVHRAGSQFAQALRFAMIGREQTQTFTRQIDFPLVPLAIGADKEVHQQQTKSEISKK